MATWNIGSLATFVYGIVPNILDNISGNLVNLADQQRIFAQTFTGQPISSTNIPEQYQPGLVDLTCAEVIALMESQMGNSRIADLSTGMDSSKLREEGLRKLRELGRHVNFYKAFG